MNTLRPRQNGCHFADDIFKSISWMNAHEFRLIFSLNNILAWAQIMNWRRPGDKPLSEPMMVSLPTHICVCVSRPQWVKLLCFSNQLGGFTATWKIVKSAYWLWWYCFKNMSHCNWSVTEVFLAPLLFIICTDNIYKAKPILILKVYNMQMIQIW